MLAIPKAYRDYRTFVSYGPGGIPNNVFGWLSVTLFLSPLSRGMLDTAIYDHKINAETAPLLQDLPERRDERPVVGAKAVERDSGNDVKDKLMDEFTSFAARNTSFHKLAPSHLERHNDALWLADSTEPASWTDVAKQMHGEIAHVHGLGDFSGHVILSPADCKKLIESGWGEQHALSGSRVIRPLTLGRVPSLPAEYVLIYAPRDEEEARTVMKIFSAGVEYMTGPKGVRV